jgi:hypothetical protein
MVTSLSDEESIAEPIAESIAAAPGLQAGHDYLLLAPHEQLAAARGYQAAMVKAIRRNEASFTASGRPLNFRSACSRQISRPGTTGWA